jgi:hypothetical protein
LTAESRFGTALDVYDGVESDVDDGALSFAAEDGVSWSFAPNARWNQLGLFFVSFWSSGFGLRPSSELDGTAWLLPSAVLASTGVDLPLPKAGAAGEIGTELSRALSSGEFGAAAALCFGSSEAEASLPEDLVSGFPAESLFGCFCRSAFEILGQKILVDDGSEL